MATKLSSSQKLAIQDHVPTKCFFVEPGTKLSSQKLAIQDHVPTKCFFVALAVKKSAFVLQRWQSRKALPLNPANICFRSLSQSLPFKNLLLLLPWLLRFAVWVSSWSSMSCMFVSLVVFVWVLCSLVWSLYEFCVVWSGLCMSFVLSGMVWSGLVCVLLCCAVQGGEGKHTSHQFSQGRHTSPKRKVYEWGDIPLSFSLPGMQISVHVTFTQMLD